MLQSLTILEVYTGHGYLIKKLIFHWIFMIEMLIFGMTFR